MLVNIGVVRGSGMPNYSMIVEDHSMNIYYVYAYLREDGTPYYIGKGKDKRAYVIHRRSNGTNLLPKDKNNIKIIAHKLFEHEAFLLEQYLILTYGRKDLGTGILQNMANGGEGRTGPITYSEESKKIRTEKMSGDKNPSKRPEVKLAKKKKMTEFWQNNPEKKKKIRSRMSSINNPNNVKLSCLHCKRETSLPIFGRDHSHEQ